MVAFIKEDSFVYPDVPFNPGSFFPEFSKFLFNLKIDKDNNVYSQVRDLLIKLELDKKNIGYENWNPFRNLVKKGEKIIIKPNLVSDKHPLGQEGVLSMITHASVLRPVIDYILLAVGNNCEITICDVPLQSANWENLINSNGLKGLVEFYEEMGIKINLLDLRYEIAIPDKEGLYRERFRKVRDPRGYVIVDLAQKSYLQEIIKDYKRLEITDYGSGTVAKHHNPEKNEYLLPKTILEADVFINIPKLKTHKKAGVTLSMKNLIGINSDKSWIAHHRRGVDEYPKFELREFIRWKIGYYMKAYMPYFMNSLVRKCHRFLLKRKVANEHNFSSGNCSLMEGNWYGNDTLWRSILDLNNILFFADKNGCLKNTVQRKYFSLIDGIIGMDGDGPMHGQPKNSGILIGGFHPVSVDFISAHLMGFDYQKIPTIRNSLQEKYFNLVDFKENEIIVKSNFYDWRKINLEFASSHGWIGNIER
jgi:uncharacterized protein (DUF362 family)